MVPSPTPAASSRPSRWPARAVSPARHRLRGSPAAPRPTAGRRISRGVASASTRRAGPGPAREPRDLREERERVALARVRPAASSTPAVGVRRPAPRSLSAPQRAQRLDDPGGSASTCARHAARSGSSDLARRCRRPTRPAPGTTRRPGRRARRRAPTSVFSLRPRSSISSTMIELARAEQRRALVEREDFLDPALGGTQHARERRFERLAPTPRATQRRRGSAALTGSLEPSR